MSSFLKVGAGLGLLLTSFSFMAAGLPQQGGGSVTTPCGHTYTYNSSNVGVISTSSNGQTTSTVYVDGQAVLTETCPSSGGTTTAGNGPGGTTQPPRKTPPTRPTPPTPPNRSGLLQYLPSFNQ